MALFSKNVITQVSGFDNPLITGELVYNQNWYWNITLLDSANEPVDLSTATITASIVRRQVSNLIDTRNGLSFDVANYTPTPTAITLTITNKVDAAEIVEQKQILKVICAAQFTAPLPAGTVLRC